MQGYVNSQCTYTLRQPHRAVPVPYICTLFFLRVWKKRPRENEKRQKWKKRTATREERKISAALCTIWQYRQIIKTRFPESEFESDSNIVSVSCLSEREINYK